MKEFICRLEMAFAVLTSKKVAVFIDKGDLVVRYISGMSAEEADELKELDYQ